MSIDLSDVPAKYKNMYRKAGQGKLSPRKAIKLHCLQCMGWVRKETINCSCPKCPLYKYRPQSKAHKKGPAEIN